VGALSSSCVDADDCAEIELGHRDGVVVMFGALDGQRRVLKRFVTFDSNRTGRNCERRNKSEAKLICALLQLFESLAGRCSQSELGRKYCHICSFTYPCTVRQTRIDTVLHFRSDNTDQSHWRDTSLLDKSCTAAARAIARAQSLARKKSWSLVPAL
jgi:hypothetical protein